MNPRVILYMGMVLAVFPLFGMWQYVSIIISVPVDSHDPEMLRQLIERVVMLGVYSWPLWLGVVGYSILRWHQLKVIERTIAWIPMIVFLSCYILVMTH